MFGVTNQIIRHDPDVDVVMFYLSSFDNIAHAFWQYRFPDEVSGDRPSAADIEALGPVIGRYLEYLDAQLAHLIAAFPTEPNILIVADHGQEASEDYPLWKGWHSRFGVFLAAGPSIARRPEALAVSYYDIAPTMLDLLGFAPAGDLRGRSLLAR
jgi:predicted AlkP superfamily phosphohydrolase/phosphomutase